MRALNGREMPIILILESTNIKNNLPQVFEFENGGRGDPSIQLPL